MNIRQIVCVTVIALFLLSLIFESIRRRLLREKYALVWLLIGITAFSIPWLYDGYLVVAEFLGIVTPTSFFFFLAITGLALLSFQFSLALTSAYKQRKAMLQHLALLEQRVRTLEEKDAPNTSAAPLPTPPDRTE